MTDLIEWGRENATIIIIFLLFWCAIYLERIDRRLASIRGMIAVEYRRRTGEEPY